MTIRGHLDPAGENSVHPMKHRQRTPDGVPFSQVCPEYIHVGNAEDQAVLDIHRKPSIPLDLKVELAAETPTLGGQVYFLGYPFGLHSLYDNGEYVPLVKAGVFSGLDNSDPTELLYYIDGFNNPGFSGGPCVYIDNSTHVWRIFGVIQGYKPDSIKTKIRGKDVDTGLLSNSGILLAYPIDEALKAIDLTLAK